MPTKLAKIPDFVLHVPGRMDRNICVVEVKCVARVDRRSARKDLEKLIAYVSYGRYQCGVYLTVGVGAGDRVRRYAQEFIRRLGGITLLEHREAGREATAVPWSLVVTERP
ncbi:MAG: hypothetical protein HYZ29_37320 [Myxococcales bacterium]|nr:hypothetical protein [Myxococcales bacterium]